MGARVWSFLLLAAGMVPFGLQAREIPLTIVHTSDLHGRVLPFPDARAGCLLKAATVIKRIRMTEPHVLLLDGGDLLQGSAESRLSGGRVVTRALRLLGCEAVVPGNHDFDFGWRAFVSAREEWRAPGALSAAASPPGWWYAFTPQVYVPRLLGDASGFGPVCLAANMGGIRWPPPCDAVLMRAWDGLRVAVVGLTTPAVPIWHGADITDRAWFGASIPVLETLMPALNALSPDIRILLAHQGWRHTGDDEANELHAIAKRFPDFDLILGGHLHYPRAVGRMAQPGDGGAYVVVARLIYDTVRRGVVRRQVELIATADEIPDEALANALEPWLTQTRAWLDERVGFLPETLTAPRKPSPLGSNPMQQLLCRAVARATGAEVVLHGLLAPGEKLAAGAVSRRDLWRIVPYENTLVVVQWTPAELHAALEAIAASPRMAASLGVYGVRFRWDRAAADGGRIRELRPAAGVWSPLTRLKVALNSHTVHTARFRSPALAHRLYAPDAQPHWTGIETRAAVEAELRRTMADQGK